MQEQPGSPEQSPILWYDTSFLKEKTIQTVVKFNRTMMTTSSFSLKDHPYKHPDKRWGDSGAGIRILLVDDNEELLLISKIYIESNNEFLVDIAISAQKGLEKLDICPYDLIISDYDMPGMNGISFLEKIRHQGHPIPFIIFSGRTRDEIPTDSCVPEAFFLKGSDPDTMYMELVSLMHEIIRNYNPQYNSFLYTHSYSE